MSRRRSLSWLPFRAALLTALLFAPSTLAQEPDPMTLQPLPRSGDTVEWYSVAAGDTLQGLTARFLGTPRLWRENYRLNPQVRNPDLLLPGQRLRIITARPTEAREAEVTVVSRKVQEQLYPDTVKDAEVGDRLKERDGIRTFAASSTELALDENSRLAIGENSLVFLQRVDESLVGVRREVIDLQRGEAELAATRIEPRKREIEIILGDARARPGPGPEGEAQTRAKRPEDGGAKVMVYGGESQVESAGTTVEVPSGMGTSVPEGGPPSPPEALLPAPVALAPAVAAELGFTNPELIWQPVEGAASYTVEVCADPECRSLFARRGGLTEPHWRLSDIPGGAWHWRVTAVSASGLDGYPARARALSTRGGPDLEPPAVALTVEPPGLARTDGGVVLDRGGSLAVHSVDDVSGVEEIRYRWNDGPWRTLEDASRDRLQPDGEGPWSLTVIARDRAGRDSPALEASVEAGSVAPKPPTARWQRAGGDSG